MNSYIILECAIRNKIRLSFFCRIDGGGGKLSDSIWESFLGENEREKTTWQQLYGQKDQKPNEVMAGSIEMRKVFLNSGVSRLGKSSRFDLDGKFALLVFSF